MGKIAPLDSAGKTDAVDVQATYFRNVQKIKLVTKRNKRA